MYTTKSFGPEIKTPTSTTDLNARVAALEKRIAALEKVIKTSARGVQIESDLAITLKANTVITLDAGAQAELKAGIIRLGNSASRPVATVGSTVATTPGTGTILTGSPNVFA